jgi:hypothetical protein
MKDDRNHRKQQKNVDEESRDMEDQKSTKPQQKKENSET